jgi:hypothetical protein
LIRRLTLTRAPLRTFAQTGTLSGKMKPLTIALTKGSLHQLQSIGWKTAKAGDCRRYFYALDQAGKPLVVTPKLALPRSYYPSRQVPVVFTCEPFSEAVCVEILPCRLLPPVCYESDKDFERQLPCHYEFEPWKAIYWDTHREALILKPEHDGPLEERRVKWLAAMRAAHEQEAASWRDRITRTETATLQELGFKTEDQRAQNLANLREQLDIVESESRIDGVPCKGRLKLTLEEVKQGHEGIRDAWLHEEWAAKNGEDDLPTMARARRILCRFLKTHTGTPATIVGSTTPGGDVTPPHLGEKYEQDPRFLEACASVRYQARFADNANTILYLADCELREELTAEELDEVAKLTAIAQPAQAVDSVDFQPSSNYRQLFWTDDGKKEEAKLTKTQAAALSALHNAPGCILARDEWQQEIYGDQPPNEFRPDKVFAYGDGRKVRDRFIRVENDRYRLVIERG